MATEKSDVKYQVVTQPVDKVILHVHDFFNGRPRIVLESAKIITVTNLIQMTADATGITRQTLHCIRKSSFLESAPKFHHDIKRCKKPEVPIEFLPIIRMMMRDMIISEKKIPKLSEMHQKLVKGEFEAFEGIEKPSWTWSKETLRRFMHKSGFLYDPRSIHYDYVKKRNDILLMRSDYYEWIADYRAKNYQIFYQDETWVFKNLSTSRVWRPKDICQDDIYYRVPAGPGQRAILCHLGSAETSLFSDSMLLFRGSKDKDPDYHSEMNGELFLKWLKEKVFPKIKESAVKSVVVVDRAKYHTMITSETKPPTTSWRKAYIILSIERWGGPSSEWQWSPNWKTEKKSNCSRLLVSWLQM
ncbi:MAG: hypothetical protein AAGG81_06875 [Chlamydiota bacterium]